MNFHENTREFPRTNEAWIDAEGCLGWQNKGSAGWAYLPIGINQSVLTNQQEESYYLRGHYCFSMSEPAMALQSPYQLAR